MSIFTICNGLCEAGEELMVLGQSEWSSLWLLGQKSTKVKILLAPCKYYNWLQDQFSSTFPPLLNKISFAHKQFVIVIFSQIGHYFLRRGAIFKILVRLPLKKNDHFNYWDVYICLNIVTSSENLCSVMVSSDLLCLLVPVKGHQKYTEAIREWEVDHRKIRKQLNFLISLDQVYS